MDWSKLREAAIMRFYEVEFTVNFPPTTVIISGDKFLAPEYKHNETRHFDATDQNDITLEIVDYKNKFQSGSLIHAHYKRYPSIYDRSYS